MLQSWSATMLTGEALVRSLIGDGYTLLASVEQTETGRLATVRLGSPLTHGDIVVALLFASSGIESEIVHGAEMNQVVPGLVLPIATTGHLIALKLLARDDEARPQDLADLRALRMVATESDLAAAREAVRLISERGFSRRRNLYAALQAIERTAGESPGTASVPSSSAMREVVDFPVESDRLPISRMIFRRCAETGSVIVNGVERTAGAAASSSAKRVVWLLTSMRCRVHFFISRWRRPTSPGAMATRTLIRCRA